MRSEFYRDRSRPDGPTVYCKSCKCAVERGEPCKTGVSDRVSKLGCRDRLYSYRELAVFWDAGFVHFAFESLSVTELSQALGISRSAAAEVRDHPDWIDDHTNDAVPLLNNERKQRLGAYLWDRANKGERDGTETRTRIAV